MVFVGRQHEEILHHLKDRWDQIVDGDEAAPRLITLVGHQGVGKSQIIKEFYRHIAGHQTAPPYWPEVIRPTQDLRHSRDPMPQRKVLGPVVDVWPAGALPDFLWWDFEGDLLTSGSASPALLAGEAKLRKHERAIWEAYLRRTGIWNRLNRSLKRAVRDLASDQSIEQAGRMLADAGVVIPGLGFAVQRTIAGVRYGRERKKARRDLLAEVSLDDGTADLGIELASRVEALSGCVPVVVVIEDAHWAEPAFCGFVRHLATSRAKVLVLASAWTEGMSLSEPKHYYGSLAVELLTAGFAERIAVDPPSAGERAVLVRSLAEEKAWRMPDEVVDALVERYATPLGLALALTSDFMQDFVGDGYPRDELEEMPATLKGLYEARWAELDSDVRDVLILAALLSPWGATQGVSSDGRVTLRIIQDCLTELETVLPRVYQALHEGTVAQTKYAEALNDPAWLMRIARETEQFREPELALVAMERASERGLKKATRSRARRVYLDVLRGVLDDDESPVQPLAAAHYLTLDAVLDEEVPDDRHLGLAAVVSAREYALAYQFREAVSVLASVKDRVDETTRIDVLRDAASICEDASLWEEAVDYYRELLDLLGADLSSFDPAVAGIVANLARCELQLGRYCRVEQLLTRIVDTLPTQLDEPTIRLRRLHANAIRGDRRRLQEAEGLLKTLLSDLLKWRVDSAMWDEQEADTRMALAITLEREGRSTDALPHIEAVIRLRSGVFGPDGYQTLTAMGEKALVLKGIVGREGEGAALQTAIFDRRMQLFGARHPQTLKSRHSVAFSLISTNPMVAAADLEGVLADKREVLGPHHPSTIKSLSALARAWGEAREFEKSLAIYDEAVALREQFDSPDRTILVRRKRLGILRQIDCVQALHEAQRLVVEANNQLGATSVGTLRARFEEAETVAMCESRERGLELHLAVLADRRTHLPAGNKDVAESVEAIRRLDGEANEDEA